MSDHKHLSITSAADMERLGAEIALFSNVGDVIALNGPLGSGKTIFARGFVRSIEGDDGLEVPSPTFTLAQTYDNGRFSVTHFDLFRLDQPGDAVELGIDEAIDLGVAIVEWPANADLIEAAGRLEIEIVPDNGDIRSVSLSASGTWRSRLTRAFEVRDYLAAAGWSNAQRRYIQGDASSRRYERLERGDDTLILMDTPLAVEPARGETTPAYSDQVHLAVSLIPFMAMAGGLRARGLSAPEIMSANPDQGLMLLEDLGSKTFADLYVDGALNQEIYRCAVDVLVTIATNHVPPILDAGDGAQHALPRFDTGAFMAEACLLPQWYYRMAMGGDLPDDARTGFETAIGTLFDLIQATGVPEVCALRDFHSPNLLWLNDRSAAARVGLIDFQDAVFAPLGYDLVSLLQDARIDVPEATERAMTEYFAHAMEAAGHTVDKTAFSTAYAGLGAHRAMKILGIFARLAKRDHRPGYIKHIPRVWRYLDRNLEHTALGELAAWFDRHIPREQRCERMPDRTQADI